MIIDVTPVGKPRMTRRDRWHKRPATMKYFSFVNEIKWKYPKFALANRIRLTFVMPMPKSWSKKKKQLFEGKPHQQKPDIDNLIKAFLDAVTTEDKFVSEVWASKIWGKKGYIIYDWLPKAIKDEAQRQTSEPQEKKAPARTPRGVGTQRSLRVRGVSPRARRRQEE